MSDHTEEKLPSDIRIEEEKKRLEEAYKTRGFQRQNLNDYLLLKKQQDERKKSRLPAAVRIVLTTPIILLFCIGLIFIPFMIYLFITTK